MTLPSDRGKGEAGVTLLEALVALGIIALVSSVAVTALRPPSPALVLEQQAAELISEAATARSQAIHTAAPVALELPGCGAVLEAVFHPDGTARGTGACLTERGATLRLRLSPLTGRLVPERVR